MGLSIRNVEVLPLPAEKGLSDRKGLWSDRLVFMRTGPYSSGLGRWTREADVGLALATLTLPYSSSVGRLNADAPGILGRGLAPTAAGLDGLDSSKVGRRVPAVWAETSVPCFIGPNVLSDPAASNKGRSRGELVEAKRLSDDDVLVGWNRTAGPIGLGLSGNGLGDTSGGSMVMGDSDISL